MTDKPTHTVKHPGLYRRINGQLQPVPVGTEITLTRKQGTQMEKRGFAVAIAPGKPEKVDEKSKKTAKS